MHFALDKYALCCIISNMKSKCKDIEKQLKRAILGSEMTRYRISKESGLTESQLSYFVNGKRSLTLPAAAKLAKALGLELVQKKGRKKTR
jgi:transcriptional regulator with XRE-family HTH domain